MKIENKKLAIIIFIILIFYSAIPKPAFAAAAITFESNPLVWISNQLSAASGATTAAASKVSASSNTLTASGTIAANVQKLFEWAFKIAVESLKRQLLNMIVDQIVAWIQGGGDYQRD